MDRVVLFNTGFEGIDLKNKELSFHFEKEVNRGEFPIYTNEYWLLYQDRKFMRGISTTEKLCLGVENVRLLDPVTNNFCIVKIEELYDRNDPDDIGRGKDPDGKYNFCVYGEIGKTS